MANANLTMLQATKTQILNNLLDLSQNPKPTYSLDGQSVSWESYFQMLTTQLSAINELIVVESGPFAFITVGES